MPAKSKKQQMAAGAALAAKRGKRFEIIVAGRVAPDGEIDERKTTARFRENETQMITEKEAQALTVLSPAFVRRSTIVFFLYRACPPSHDWQP